MAVIIALGILIYLALGFGAVVSLLGAHYHPRGRPKWSFGQVFRTLAEDRWVWLYCIYIALGWLPMLLILRFKK